MTFDDGPERLDEPETVLVLWGAGERTKALVSAIILVVVAGLCLLSGCAWRDAGQKRDMQRQARCAAYQHGWAAVMPVRLQPTTQTPSGVLVDASGVVLPAGWASTIDARIDAMEECVLSLRRQGKVQAPDLDRSCIAVKVVPAYRVSDDGKWELLPAEAPAQGCVDKGLPGEDCRWRWGLQEQADSAGRTALVTPPALYLGELIRAWLDVDPWTHPDLARCAELGLTDGLRVRR